MATTNNENNTTTTIDLPDLDTTTNTNHINSVSPTILIFVSCFFL